MDPYEVLGLTDRTVDAAVIKQRYRKLAKLFHPDRNAGDPDAERLYKEVVDAYEVLGDPERRKVYDETGDLGGIEVDHDLAEMLDCISDHLLKILSELFKMDKRVENEDILALIKHSMDEQLEASEAARKSIVRTKTALEACLGRFKIEDEENVMNGLLKMHIERTDAQIAHLAESVRLTAKARAMLDKYQYQFTRSIGRGGLAGMDSSFLFGKYFGGRSNPFGGG